MIIMIISSRDRDNRSNIFKKDRECDWINIRRRTGKVKFLLYLILRNVILKDFAKLWWVVLNICLFCVPFLVLFSKRNK